MCVCVVAATVTLIMPPMPNLTESRKMRVHDRSEEGIDLVSRGP